jgi:hypothetical protein
VGAFEDARVWEKGVQRAGKAGALAETRAIFNPPVAINLILKPRCV